MHCRIFQLYDLNAPANMVNGEKEIPEVDKSGQTAGQRHVKAVYLMVRCAS